MKQIFDVLKSKGWTATYKSDDWGTERLVTVKDSEGNIIGQRDPFYPVGIPASKRKQEDRIRKVIRDIVLDYQQKQAEKLSTNPLVSQFLEKEILRKSHAKTAKGFISDFVRAVDDITGEKGWGKDELSSIDAPRHSKTVEERLLAGESVSWNTKEFGYDLDPLSGQIYVYIRYKPDE